MRASPPSLRFTHLEPLNLSWFSFDPIHHKSAHRQRCGWSPMILTREWSKSTAQCHPFGQRLRSYQSLHDSWWDLREVALRPPQRRRVDRPWCYEVALKSLFSHNSKTNSLFGLKKATWKAHLLEKREETKRRKKGWK